MVASGHFDLRPLRHHSHRHEYVVPLQPGAAGRAADGRLRGRRRISADRDGRQPAQRSAESGLDQRRPRRPLGVISVGASGAVFGLAGVLIPLLGSKLLPVNRSEVARLRRSVIYFAVLNFVMASEPMPSTRRYASTTWRIWADFSLGCCWGCCWCQSWESDRTLWIRRQWLAFGSVLLAGAAGSALRRQFLAAPDAPSTAVPGRSPRHRGIVTS